MRRSHRTAGALLATLLAALAMPFAPSVALAASAASVPAGFVDEPLMTGLDHPMAIAIAPNGNVFVAEKRGTIQLYSSLTDRTPTVFADLNTQVHNYWDRGLMGIAVDPGYPAAPYVYVLYAYNHILGHSDAEMPRWPSADALVPPGSVYDDRCTNPPRATTDGCVISGRLSRLTVSGGVMSGPEKVLIEDWCQQFPSHSLGGLMFGPEGALYVSAGEGAGFTLADYGQLGGTLDGTPTPKNPCGDPPTPAGTDLVPPSAEGGALRSQDLRTSGDPVGLDGAILRIDPATGLGWPGNFLAGSSDLNARKIVAYGLRNPYRFTIRPGTKEVWVGDVGWNTWEEVNRVPDLATPTGTPNFGWPCWEGPAVMPTYDSLGVSICETLTPGGVTLPYFTYNHAEDLVTGDGCGHGSSSVSGLAFLPGASAFPASYHGGLFMADYTRRCIWFAPAGANGLPDMSARSLFANLRRSDGSLDGGAVYLTITPAGDLLYADYDRGEVRRVKYLGLNAPPTAQFDATPTFGTAPLTVSFDASASSDIDPLSYAWDLDGDGQFDDSTSVAPTWTYKAAGDVTVGLRVTDPDLMTDTATRTISVGNTAPTVTIEQPTSSLTWKVGDVIPFSASATDQQDGTLPPTAFDWTLTVRHCPSDCHSHVIETHTGVTSGTFEGPDHDYPSHLLLSVTVTDANGVTGSDSVELYPRTSTVGTTTDPPGIATSVNQASGVAPVLTAIEGSRVGVSAPQTAAFGEKTYAFGSWSPGGGAPSHDVVVTAAPQTLTAHYVQTGSTDASNTCSGAGAAVAPSGQWQPARFGTANDVDWYRLRLTSAKTVRFVLGDLSTTGRLELYRGCSTFLQRSDRSGTAAEEIIRTLPAGTYAVRLVGGAVPETADHVLLVKTLPSGVRVLTARSRVEGSQLRLVGEVYNNSSRTTTSVYVTARLYNATGHLLATRRARVALPYLAAHTRSPFSIVGPLPAGYHHATWSVSAPVTSSRVSAPTRTTTTSGLDGSGHWVVSGVLRNRYGTTATSVAMAVTMYDQRGTVLDVAKATLGTTTLRPGRSTTYRARFLPTGLAPDVVYLRGVMRR